MPSWETNKGLAVGAMGDCRLGTFFRVTRPKFKDSITLAGEPDANPPTRRESGLRMFGRIDAFELWTAGFQNLHGLVLKRDGHMPVNFVPLFATFRLIRTAGENRFAFVREPHIAPLIQVELKPAGYADDSLPEPPLLFDIHSLAPLKNLSSVYPLADTGQPHPNSPSSTVFKKAKIRSLLYLDLKILHHHIN